MLTQNAEDSTLLNTFKSGSMLEWKEIRERLQSPITLTVPIKLHLIRHAQSKINANKQVTGSQDVELTSTGEEQAASLAEKLLPRYDIAFTSTLKRSQKTLELAIKSGSIEVGETFRDSRLNERCLGVLEGQEWCWIPEYADGDLTYAPQNGESYEAVAKRVLSFLIELADYTLEYSIKKILISGHMGPMRIMVGILGDKKNSATVLNFTFSNTEVVELTWSRLAIPGFLKDFLELKL